MNYSWIMPKALYDWSYCLWVLDFFHLAFWEILLIWSDISAPLYAWENLKLLMILKLFQKDQLLGNHFLFPLCALLWINLKSPFPYFYNFFGALVNKNYPILFFITVWFSCPLFWDFNGNLFLKSFTNHFNFYFFHSWG